MKTLGENKNKIVIILGVILLARMSFRDLSINGEINWVANIFITVVAMVAAYWIVHIPDRGRAREERKKRNMDEFDNQ